MLLAFNAAYETQAREAIVKQTQDKLESSYFLLHPEFL